jgi:hypothetical protein
MKAATPSSRPSLGPETPLTRAVCSSPQSNECAAGRPVQADKAPCLPKVAQEDFQWDKTEDERFHLNCVVAQVWLLQLRRYTETRYADSAGARRPALQTGYARRSFCTLFEPPSAIEAVRLFENLLRFANYESAAPARTFFLAYAPLVFEHDVSGEYIGPGVWTPEAGSKNAAVRVRRTLQRWCDWLEALMHFQIHDLHRPGTVPRELDQAMIFLWPLLTRHKWSAPDLLAVLRSFLDCSANFPCQSEEQLATYCRTALGLRLPNRRMAVEDGVLAGREVAERLFRFLPTIG